MYFGKNRHFEEEWSLATFCVRRGHFAYRRRWKFRDERSLLQNINSHPRFGKIRKVKENEEFITDITVITVFVYGTVILFYDSVFWCECRNVQRYVKDYFKISIFCSTACNSISGNFLFRIVKLFTADIFTVLVNSINAIANSNKRNDKRWSSFNSCIVLFLFIRLMRLTKFLSLGMWSSNAQNIITMSNMGLMIISNSNSFSWTEVRYRSNLLWISSGTLFCLFQLSRHKRCMRLETSLIRNMGCWSDIFQDGGPGLVMNQKDVDVDDEGAQRSSSTDLVTKRVTVPRRQRQTRRREKTKVGARRETLTYTITYKLVYKECFCHLKFFAHCYSDNTFGLNFKLHSYFSLTLTLLCSGHVLKFLNVEVTVVYKMNWLFFIASTQQTSGSFVCNFYFMILVVMSVFSVWSSIFYIESLNTRIRDKKVGCSSVDSSNLFSCLFMFMKFLNLVRQMSNHSWDNCPRTHTRTYTSFYILYILYITLNILEVNLLVIKMRLLLSGDIEMNPGPNFFDRDLLLLTQNCRGLNNRNKLRQLMVDKNNLVKGKCYILALQETYLVEDSMIPKYEKFVFTKAESNHSAGCITFLPETVKVVEKIDIDDKGHGHLIVVEGLSSYLTIIGNIYAPVRSLNAAQADFYAKLSNHIDELESKCMIREPELILMGDFNLPLEIDTNLNYTEKVRAQNLAAYLSSLGLVDCWKNADDRITLRGGNSRLDRIMYRIDGTFKECLCTVWTFTASDHCLLMLELKKEQVQKKFNRRVTALPVYLLQSSEDRSYIQNGLDEFKEMMNNEWTGKTKLEFLKMGLRTVVGECVKIRNKREREEMEHIQKELEKRMVRRRTATLRGMDANRIEKDMLFN